jgi:Heparinase II/III-like protein
VEIWGAEHDGYLRLSTPTKHRRSVKLDSPLRHLTVVDTFDATATFPLRLSWHLGPDIVVDLEGSQATLSWQVGPGRRQGTMLLPDELTWTVNRAEVDPISGWYAPRFGSRVPASSLVGQGIGSPATRLFTELELP